MASLLLFCQEMKGDGGTLSKVREIVERYKSDNVISPFPLKVREKENLLPPPSLYLRKLNYAKDFLMLLEQNIEVEEMERIGIVPEKALNAEKENLKLSRKLFESLPEYLKEDGIEIGKTILQWCCRIADEEMSMFV